MKVFISWSGDASKEVAFALRDWLPKVLQEVDPFVSPKDIAAGKRWQGELADELQDTSFGLACVTRDNQESPWLNFEAGALAKAVDSSRVIPLAIDLSLAELKNPLAQFHAKLLKKEELREVVGEMNESCDSKIPIDRLQEIFDKWWPELRDELNEFEEGRKAGGEPSTEPERPDSRELTEEILTTVRSLARSSVQPSKPAPMEVAVARVHETADKDEKAQILRPVLLKRIADLREEQGQITLAWPELIAPFPSGGGVRIGLRQAFRELRESGEVSCKVDPEPGPDEGFGGGKEIRLEG